ncbi:MAG TPA: c-type cytochrome [Bryobacteraceae bacterium]
MTILMGMIGALAALAASAPDARRGQNAFENRCTGCHSLDKIKVGPRLRGIYGRRSGKDEQFDYSDAVKNAGVTWDAPTLDRWLADTDTVIPGNDMSFRLSNSAERADIIAYLKQLSDK